MVRGFHNLAISVRDYGAKTVLLDSDDHRSKKNLLRTTAATTLPTSSKKEMSTQCLIAELFFNTPQRRQPPQPPLPACTRSWHSRPQARRAPRTTLSSSHSSA